MTSLPNPEYTVFPRPFAAPSLRLSDLSSPCSNQGGSVSPNWSAFLLERIKCQSRVFFPEGERIPPQPTDCPRDATTTRRTAKRLHAEIIKVTLHRCEICARDFDQGENIRP